MLTKERPESPQRITLRRGTARRGRQRTPDDPPTTRYRADVRELSTSSVHCPTAHGAGAAEGHVVGVGVGVAPEEVG